MVWREKYLLFIMSNPNFQIEHNTKVPKLSCPNLKRPQILWHIKCMNIDIIFIDSFCKFSLFRMGNLAPDRYLMVYDLRFIRAMAPIKVVVDPTFLRFIPAYTNKLCVVSQVCITN